jgi:hypothetical protein
VEIGREFVLDGADRDSEHTLTAVENVDQFVGVMGDVYGAAIGEKGDFTERT